jgi:hypothetical protein
MNVRQLMGILSLENPDREILLASDEEINVISEIDRIVDFNISTDPEEENVQLVICPNGVTRE